MCKGPIYSVLYSLIQNVTATSAGTTIEDSEHLHTKYNIHLILYISWPWKLSTHYVYITYLFYYYFVAKYAAY